MKRGARYAGKYEFYECNEKDGNTGQGMLLLRNVKNVHSFAEHKTAAEEARRLSTIIAEMNHENNIFYIDLQKGIILPRMPGIKRECFTKCITAFNETFAPVGAKKNLKSKGRPYAVTWHEGITKRDADDIASSFIKWLLRPGIRDHQVITVWMDTCGAQGNIAYYIRL